MEKSDKHQVGIEERARFLAWLREHVPSRYRQMTETDECFSALKDFEMLWSAEEEPYKRFNEKRKQLALVNFGLAKFWPHILGNKDKHVKGA